MSYPGGKAGAGVAQFIINEQPPHRRYFELFLGSGAVMRLKRPAPIANVGLDLDKFAILGFPLIDRGAPLNVSHGDALEYLSSHRWDSADLIYCDPPYLANSRRGKRPIYRCEFSSESEHKLLLAMLRELPCMVQLSGYDSTLYAEMLQGWRLLKFQTMTRRGPAIECLWMNYSEPTSLHDYRFLGDGFRERERIKRKTLRWARRISSLPILERTALFSAMAAIAGSSEKISQPGPLDGFDAAGSLRRNRHSPTASPEMVRTAECDRAAPDPACLAMQEQFGEQGFYD
jgi:hypothetical protein